MLKWSPSGISVGHLRHSGYCPLWSLGVWTSHLRTPGTMQLTALQPHGISLFSHTWVFSKDPEGPCDDSWIFIPAYLHPLWNSVASSCLRLLELRPLCPSQHSGCTFLGSHPGLWLEGATGREPEQLQGPLMSCMWWQSSTPAVQSLCRCCCDFVSFSGWSIWRVNLIIVTQYDFRRGNSMRYTLN